MTTAVTPIETASPSSTRQLAASVVRRRFEARNELRGSAWVNTHGWIPRGAGAPEPGPYSTERAPYLTEIIDVMDDEVHTDVVVRKPGQAGFTEAIAQVIGSWLKEDPSGILLIQPNIDLAKAWMKERMDKLLDESPALQGLIRSEGGRRSSDDTMVQKMVPGGHLVVAGANSAVGLRGRPIRRLIGDERSGWTRDAKLQGDPWELGLERTTNFWNRKRIQGSTPGDHLSCPLTRELEQSDWREYHVACPACGFREPFQWRASDRTYRIVCDKDATDHPIPETARYLCMACGVLIPETEKQRMLLGGRWIPKFLGRETAGFDFNGLASPWRTWRDVMKQWLRAQREPEKMTVFDSHVLGQPSGQHIERIDVHSLLTRQEKVEPLPAKIGALFGSIDVQGDRVESLVIGVGVGVETWCLQWRQHDGSPDTAKPWEDAWEAMHAVRGAPLLGVAIDTGYLTDEAWKWVSKWNGAGGVHVLGVKGIEGRGRPWISMPLPTKKKRERRPWMIGADVAKDALSLRLPMPVPPGGAGAIHIAETIPDVFCEQVMSEELKWVLVRGRLVRAWRPITPDRRNEGLDLLLYALGAVYARGPRFLQMLFDLVANRPALTAAAPSPASEGPAGYGMVSKGVDW